MQGGHWHTPQTCRNALDCARLQRHHRSPLCQAQCSLSGLLGAQIRTQGRMTHHFLGVHPALSGNRSVRPFAACSRTWSRGFLRLFAQRKTVRGRPSMKDSQKSVGSKHFGFRAVAVISLALALCGVAAAQNAVIDWNAIAVTAALNGDQAISPGSNTSGGTSLYLAYTHLAIYDAVNAIDHRFQPYGAEIPAPTGASVDAAVISAAYHTLVFYFPDQLASLNAQYTASLSVIPDGQAKDDGV